MFWLVILAIIPVSMGSDIVEVYKYDQFRGDMTLLNISRCGEYKEWNADSINTRDQCVHIYNSHNCQGNFLKLQQGMQHSDLEKYGFMNKVGSVGRCTSCFDPPQFTPDDYIRLRAGSDARYLSGYIDLQIPSCLEVPTTIIQYINRTTAVTVYLKNNSCVEVYESLGCVGDSTQLLTPPVIKWWDFHLQLRNSLSIGSCRKKCTEECDQDEQIHLENLDCKILQDFTEEGIIESSAKPNKFSSYTGNKLKTGSMGKIGVWISVVLGFLALIIIVGFLSWFKMHRGRTNGFQRNCDEEDDVEFVNVSEPTDNGCEEVGV